MLKKSDSNALIVERKILSCHSFNYPYKNTCNCPVSILQHQRVKNKYRQEKNYLNVHMKDVVKRSLKKEALKLIFVFMQEKNLITALNLTATESLQISVTS